MMKSIEGGGANGESFGRAPQRGKEVPKAGELPDEGAEGSAFSSHFIGGVRRSWGVGSGNR